MDQLTGKISCIIYVGDMEMKARDRDIARQYKQRIKALTTVNRLVIFGSRARGKASPDSDLDVLIEVPHLTPELRQQIYTAAWEVGFENEIVISTFLVSTAALGNSPLSANPILRAIDKEGVAV
jgi:predicted nucleotidyltransferase